MAENKPISLTITSMAFSPNGAIPAPLHLRGKEVSPPLTWSGAPDPTASFVLVVRDIDALRGNDDTLHWLVWNIPGKSTSLPESVPHGPELPAGTRPISATGPYYRPAAPASDRRILRVRGARRPAIDVPPVGASPADADARDGGDGRHPRQGFTRRPLRSAARGARLPNPRRLCSTPCSSTRFGLASSNIADAMGQFNFMDGHRSRGGRSAAASP
jgi:hypothetical protein